MTDAPPRPPAYPAGDDRAWAAFSDDPPWVVERSTITWLGGTDALRRLVQSEVPRLTSPSRLPPGHASDGS